MYGKIDFKRIDTTPGASCVFAPPEWFEGDYQAFMRSQWQTDPGARQHMLMVAITVRRMPVTFCGPFAEQAKEIAIQIWRSIERETRPIERTMRKRGRGEGGGSRLA